MEDNKIILDLALYKLILDQEAKKLVGKICKRFEVCEDKEVVKREAKELIYESYRDIYDMLLNGKILFTFNQSKEK